jgi:hypothetical protein
MECCICKKEIEVNSINGWDQGNNARPFAEGRCCDSCNDQVVIPERFKELGYRML